jgi:nucleoside-diphosphate-sugar epimerase
MKVVITGGAGFLGLRLARKLLERGSLTGRSGRAEPIDGLVLVDVAKAALEDARVVHLAGDISDPAFVAKAIASDSATVFHLAAVVSGQAEAEFDLGMRVNLDATRLLLEACRRLPAPPRFVFASSCAVFGGELPPMVPESWNLQPQTSYGTQKVIGELLVNDYSRKGYLDGRALRLPTIAVRPGKPNKAASSFASGIIREPLSGMEAICPVAPDVPMWLSSPGAVVQHFIASHEAPASAFGPSRSLNLPGISVTVGEMARTLEDVAGKEVAARIRWEPDARIAKIVSGWPAGVEAKRASAMGMKADSGFEEIVRAYIAEELGRK